MEEDDKGYPMIRMGVSGLMFLVVPAYPGSPGQKAVKRLCVCVFICTHFWQLLHCIELLPTPLLQTPHGHLTPNTKPTARPQYHKAM